MGILDLFRRGNKESASQADSGIVPAGAIGAEFEPKNGNFFQTLEFPEADAEGKVIGKNWMEAGFNPATKSWVLWSKSIRQMDDVFQGGTTSILHSRVLFENTDFANAYGQMATFEQSQGSLGLAPLKNKTAAKLGGDYYKQFAWREGLMMSRSGRLYPVSEDRLSASNFFNEQDLVEAKAFLDRYKQQKFVPVPLVQPTADWEKAYAARKQVTDQRLNRLYYLNKEDKDSYDLALQIVAHEAPEVLYAHLQRGFNPKIFHDNPERHFSLVKAAIDRNNVDILHLLAEAGIGFSVRYNGETPVESAIRQRKYSHLRIMLMRDGAKLANYADEGKTTPAVQAIELRDNQAFRMVYLEGIDFSHKDDKGWYLIHHAFANDFASGVYAWIDEELPIDYPIDGTAYTGFSIARFKKNEPLVKLVLEHGANPDAPDYVDASSVQASVKDLEQIPDADPVKPLPEFSFELLNSDTTNEEIEKAAEIFVSSGGDLNALNEKGASLLELCWKNSRPLKPELSRRVLIPVFGRLGVDPSALLDDGTTVLTRAASGLAFDLDFVKAVAPYAKDVNKGDKNGNNILHALQLNPNDGVGHSRNVKAIVELFPELDMNRQNNDGYSNIGLAIRLSRSQTLRAMPPEAAPDFSQTTKAGWSLLDIAFTKACSLDRGAKLPPSAKPVVSDAARSVVLDMVEGIVGNGSPERKRSLREAFNRTRPDGKTVFEAVKNENDSSDVALRLGACRMKLESN